MKSWHLVSVGPQLRSEANIIRGFGDDCAASLDNRAAYLDDIVIYSNSWEDHICHISTVLEITPGQAHYKTQEVPVWYEGMYLTRPCCGRWYGKPQSAKVIAAALFPNQKQRSKCVPSQV